MAKEHGLAGAKDYIEREIAAASARYAIASGVKLAARFIPFRYRPPRMVAQKIGRIVHSRIQKRYVSWRKATHNIAIERWNASLGTDEQVVIGPQTRGVKIPLARIAGYGFDPDGFWRTLRMAQNGRKLDEERSWLRADLVDKEDASLWEIKPVDDGPTGVVQEVSMRAAFNLTRALLHFALPDQPSLIPALESGGFLVGRAETRKGKTGPGVVMLNIVDVSKEVREATVAVPFQLSLLPGLVLYILLKAPAPKGVPWEVVVLLAEAARKRASDFLDEIGKAAEAVEEAVRDARDRLEDWLGPVSEPVWNSLMAAMALVIVAAWLLNALGKALGAAVQFITPPPERPGSGEMAFTRRLPSSLRHLAPATLSGDLGGLDLTLASTHRNADVKVVTFRVASVTVHGIPEEAVADFVGYYFGLVSDVMEAVARRLSTEAQSGLVT